MLRRRLDLSRLPDDAVWLREHRPRYIFGWVAWLEQLLEQAERQGWALPDSVEQVCPYGATVLPALRERIHRQLGADVRDRYSCEECGPLAFQCPHDERYYHVAVSHVALDTVDDAGRPCAEGVAGRVLVTALHHYGTPLIRYDVGDAAALHAHCPGCGEQIQALSQLWGRRRFLLREPDGTRLFARTESHWWLRCAPVLEHRLVQTTPTDVQAEVVMARPLTDAEAEAIVRMLREVVSPRLAYHVRQVERIDKTGSYKRQDIISLLE
jgi:phenylacetate-CoA ligase